MSMPARSLPTTPTLADLLQGFAVAPAIAINDVASDSRRLGVGDVFLAIRGARSHALEHVSDEQATRLAAIVWDGDAAVSPPAGVPAFIVPDLAQRFGEIANRWFAKPSADIKVAAVTGTNGKTTVAWLLAQCWQLLEQQCGYIGTLGTGIDEITDQYGLTTPDCIELHRQFAAFRNQGASRAAIEVSSHALRQDRLQGVQVDAALFTNLSRDHIDYHGDMLAYGNTKARLFECFAPRHRIVCIDSEFGRTLADRLGDDTVLVASSAAHVAGTRRYVFAEHFEPQAVGIKVRVSSSWGDGDCSLTLYGQFNVANALQVLALLLSSDVPFDEALAVLACVTAPPGRMEQVSKQADGAAPRVFVDYAHTPAALEAALMALAPHCKGKLWCVFGCGGDRDRGKRPLMGQAVERHAHHSVLTSDNPRSEDPAAIMRDVQAGTTAAVTAIEDRAAAIAYAISNADADDVVLIAGKGHENYQVVGDRRLDFSDYQAAQQNLRRRAAS